MTLSLHRDCLACGREERYKTPPLDNCKVITHSRSLQLSATDYILSLLCPSLALPVCLLYNFLSSVDRNFELPGFNVFVLPLDPAFVLHDVFLHFVHSFSLCPSFRDGYSAKTFKYRAQFVASTL